MTFISARWLKVSSRAMCVPAGLGAAQTAALLAYVAKPPLDFEIAPICALVAFLGMLYLATAKTE